MSEEEKKEKTCVCDRCFKPKPLDTMTGVVIYGQKAKYCKPCVEAIREQE